MIDGIYILLGSNLGDKKLNLQRAIEEIVNLIGPVKSSSAIYETEAWGKTNQPSFYNQVLLIASDICPEQLLRSIHLIELNLGRVKFEKWGERIIDIDILYYYDRIIDENHLKIPHPHIRDRRFALAPLVEIAPDIIHPIHKKTQKSLLEECSDPLNVWRIISTP